MRYECNKEGGGNHARLRRRTARSGLREVSVRKRIKARHRAVRVMIAVHRSFQEGRDLPASPFFPLAGTTRCACASAVTCWDPGTSGRSSLQATFWHRITGRASSVSPLQVMSSSLSKQPASNIDKNVMKKKSTKENRRRIQIVLVAGNRTHSFPAHSLSPNPCRTPSPS